MDKAVLFSQNAGRLPQPNINKLYAATDIDGTPYSFVYLPLTKKNVKTAYCKNLWYTRN